MPYHLSPARELNPGVMGSVGVAAGVAAGVVCVEDRQTTGRKSGWIPSLLPSVIKAKHIN